MLYLLKFAHQNENRESYRIDNGPVRCDEIVQRQSAKQRNLIKHGQTRSKTNKHSEYVVLRVQYRREARHRLRRSQVDDRALANLRQLATTSRRASRCNPIEDQLRYT